MNKTQKNIIDGVATELLVKAMNNGKQKVDLSTITIASNKELVAHGQKTVTMLKAGELVLDPLVEKGQLHTGTGSFDNVQYWV